MRQRQINLVAAAVGVGLMLIALANSLVTLTTQDYRGALVTALACAALALAALAVPFARGPTGWRIAAIVLASPAVFVVSDFIRRAPHAFGGG